MPTDQNHDLEWYDPLTAWHALTLEDPLRQTELTATEQLKAALAEAYTPDPQTGQMTFDDNAFWRRITQGPVAAAAHAHSFLLGFKKTALEVNTLAGEGGGQNADQVARVACSFAHTVTNDDGSTTTHYDIDGMHGLLAGLTARGDQDAQECLQVYEPVKADRYVAQAFANHIGTQLEARSFQQQRNRAAVIAAAPTPAGVRFH